MTDPNQPPAEGGDPFAAPPPSDATPPPPGIPGDVPPPPAPVDVPAAAEVPAEVPPPPPPPAYAPPAAPAAYAAPGADVPNNMGLAIAALVVGICCSGIVGLITGIIAVVQASSVKNKAALGDIAGAQEAARKARLFSIITFVIAVVGAVIITILVATGAISTSTTT